MLVTFFAADILAGITDSLAELGLTTGTLLVAASVLTVLYNWPVWDRHLYPPGPLPLPFLGHTLWLATRQNTYKSIDGKLLHPSDRTKNLLRLIAE